jgi:hypothetical protein
VGEYVHRCWTLQLYLRVRGSRYGVLALAKEVCSKRQRWGRGRGRVIQTPCCGLWFVVLSIILLILQLIVGVLPLLRKLMRCCLLSRLVLPLLVYMWLRQRLVDGVVVEGRHTPLFHTNLRTRGNQKQSGAMCIPRTQRRTHTDVL